MPYAYSLPFKVNLLSYLVIVQSFMKIHHIKLLSTKQEVNDFFYYSCC